MDIVVSSIVDAGRLFVQQPPHPTIPSLDRLNTFMNTCYMQDGTIPDMPRPIESKSFNYRNPRNFLFGQITSFLKCIFNYLF